MPGSRATATVRQCKPKKHSTPRRLTLPSSGLAPAARPWPSFHSRPSQRRLREPLMSNVRPSSMNATSAPSCATRPSLRSSLPVGTRSLSPPLGLTSRVVPTVCASPASAPPALCQERATLACSRSVPHEAMHSESSLRSPVVLHARESLFFVSPRAIAVRYSLLSIHVRSNAARFRESGNTKIVVASSKA